MKGFLTQTGWLPFMPLKFNMELENELLAKETSLGNHHFQNTCSVMIHFGVYGFETCLSNPKKT